MMNRKCKYIFAICLVNLTIMMACLIGLELLFGNWFKPNNINKLNIIKNRTLRFKVGQLYRTETSISLYTRDKYGLRGTFKTPSEIDILTVGGSTTDQRYIRDGETWQDVLQNRFDSAGKKIVVANAGIDGQSTFGHIKNFDWWFPYVPGLRAKYIIFYVGLNDFYVTAGAGADAVISARQMSLESMIKSKSALYHALKTLQRIYLANIKYPIGHRAIDFSQMRWTPTPLQTSYPELMQTQLEEYAERLRILFERTKDFGAIPIVVTQPARMYRYAQRRLEGIERVSLYNEQKINGVDFYYMMRQLDKTTLLICREAKGICLDMAHEHLWEDSDFYDFFHMTPQGAQKVGDYLFDELNIRLPL